MVERGIIHAVSETFCFSCGAPTGTTSAQGVPMCAECRARGVAGAQFGAQYMIRSGVRGTSRGPMGRDEVVRGIAKGRYGPDDRISAVGGADSAIADHPEFRAAFIPGSEMDSRIEALRVEGEMVRRRAKIGRYLRFTGALCLLGLSAGSVWFSANSRMLVMPESWIEVIEERWVWWQMEFTETPAYVDVPTARGLPHADWNDANRKAPDARTLHEGLRGLWWSTYRELETTRRAFLAAGASAPLDPMPMVGLILVDAQMLHTRPELIGEIARAQTRLDAMRTTGPTAAATEGARLLAQGQRTGAAQTTLDFKDSDPMCALIHAEATSDVAGVRALMSDIGTTPRLLRALATVSEESKAWQDMENAGNELVKTGLGAAEGFEVLARFHSAMGDWERASEAAQRALSAGSERADMLHTVAAVSLRQSRPDTNTVTLFEQLVEHPHLAGHTNRQTVLVQAAQTKVLIGDLVGARELIEAAIEAQERDPNAAVVLADILFKDGLHAKAESVLRGLDTSDLDPKFAAMVHLWAARLYLQMNKQRLARTELEEAERLAPDWALIMEELAWAEIEGRDLLGASAAVERMVFLEPFRDRIVDPLSDGALLPPKARRLGKPMLTAMEGDVRYEQHRVALGAILAWRRNRPGHYNQLLDAVERDPDHLALNGAVAFAAIDQNDWETAATHSLSVIARRPSLGVMQSVRGLALAHLERIDEAKDPLNRSTKNDIGRSVLIRIAASAYSKAGQPEKARLLLEQAHELDPKDTRIQRALFALPIKKK